MSCAKYEDTTLGTLVAESGGFIQTGPFGSQLHARDYVDNGIPVVMPQQLGDNMINTEDIAQISERDSERLCRHQMYEGDIVFSRRGDVTRRAYITENERGWLCGTGCLLLRLQHPKCDNRYLTRFLGLPKSKSYLVQHAVGATMPNLNQNILKSVPVRLPKIETQRQVISVISAYDDLIENNRRRIQLLEQAARLLYREWFVHLRFPGHEHVKIKNGIPEGWEKKPLFEIALPTYGFSFKSKLFNTEGEGVPVVRIRDVPSGESETYTTEDAPEDKLLKNGDFLIGMDGEFHMNFWVGGKAWINQRVVRLRGIAGISDAFLRYSCEKPIQNFNATIVGTTVAHLGAKHLKSIKILFPSRNLLLSTQEFLDSIKSQIVTLSSQIQSTQKARDLLLPRLMNGEIVG